MSRRTGDQFTDWIATLRLYRFRATDRERDKNLDTLRVIACILLVFYHVVGLDPASGLRLPGDIR